MTMTLDGSGANTIGVPNSGTAQNTTSGTVVTFTGIPSGTKRITVVFNGVSTGGTSNSLVQIGSGSLTTTGYTSNGQKYTTTASSTAGFVYGVSPAAADALTGSMTICNVSGNIWVSSSLVFIGGLYCVQTGVVTLGGALDRVGITSTTPDTFDAGSVNILYE